jgi:hypothetical protein
MSAAAWNAAGYSGTGAIKQARPAVGHPRRALARID